jgi:prepilin-type N-terminal cleavage/methylation domain-containing protein
MTIVCGPTAPVRSNPPCESGFTLIEVMVALALTALVSLILLHGTRLAVAGLDRHTRAAERLDTRQSLDDLLRRTLTAAALIPRTAGGVFVGKPDAIEFLAIAEDGGPGLYRIDLAVDRGRRDRPLVLKRQLATPAGDPRIASSVVAVQIRDFHLAYFGADAANATPVWHDSWQQLNILPLMMRVILTTDGEPARPPLVVRLWNAG